jgi:hypothetical protein
MVSSLRIFFYSLNVHAALGAFLTGINIGSAPWKEPGAAGG